MTTASTEQTAAGASSGSELRGEWNGLSLTEKIEKIKTLSYDDAESFFQNLTAAEQAEMLHAFERPGERRLWIRLLAPDDAADLIQAAPEDQRQNLLGYL